jgi:hypothetical protein
MLRKLIIFLIRKRLGLKMYESFQFENQYDKMDYYWFNDVELRKYIGKDGVATDAHVSLNWLLHDDCKVVKYEPLL